MIPFLRILFFQNKNHSTAEYLNYFLRIASAQSKVCCARKIAVLYSLKRISS
ncbi:hypothetical protein LEP1GSC041_0155 [Leptospira noguchii str. 2006001870]|nr:hypothetical protein LEP1GSC041_0155 [Leptospira noguchii str. 2006001870]